MEPTLQDARETFKNLEIQSNGNHSRVPNSQLGSIQTNNVMTIPEVESLTITTGLKENTPQTVPGAEDASNLFSCSSSLSEEMEVDDKVENHRESNVKDYYSELLAESERVTNNANDIALSHTNDKPSKIRMSKLCRAMYQKYLPDIFRDTKQLEQYTQFIPNDADPYYFCRVCQTRSASRTAYYEHLTGHHKMKLIPIEHWRLDDPEIIPAEYDASNCCIECQKVFPSTSYRSHLKTVHHIEFIRWRKSEREERMAAIFNPTADFVLLFTKIYVDPKAESYACSQCSKVYKALRAFARHYYTEHNIIVELCLRSKQVEKLDEDKENSVQLTVDKVLDNGNQTFSNQSQNKEQNTKMSLSHIVSPLATNVNSSHILSPMDTNVKPPTTAVTQTINTQIEKSFPTTKTLKVNSPITKKEIIGTFPITLNDWHRSFCNKCQKTLSSQRYLITHISNRHDQYAMKCSACDIIFQGFDSALAHFHAASHKIISNSSSEKKSSEVEQCKSLDLNQQKEVVNKNNLELEQKKNANDTELPLAPSYQQHSSEGEHQKNLTPDQQQEENESSFEPEQIKDVNDFDTAVLENQPIEEKATAHNKNLRADIEENNSTSLSTFTEMLMDGPDSKCHICHITFNNRYETLMHFVETHKNQSPDVNDEREPDEENKKITATTASSAIGKFECNICRRNFDTKELLSIHKTALHTSASLKMKSKAKEIKHTVKKRSRSKRLRNTKTLSVQTRTQKKKTISSQTLCTTCNQEFNDGIDLQVHFVKIHKNQKLAPSINASGYQCYVCNKSYNCARTLKIHTSRYHKAPMLSLAENFYCSTCGKSLPSERSLKLHLTNHHIEKPNHQSSKNVSENEAEPNQLIIAPRYKCQICNERYVSTDTFRAHHTKKHKSLKPSFTKEFNCSTCDRTFDSEKSLKMHFTIIHLKKPKHDLSNNISKNEIVSNQLTIAPPYLCQICNERYISAYELKEHHIKKHKLLRPSFVKDFNCSVCDKTFDSVRSIKIHVAAQHAKKMNLEPSHKCQMCHKKYFNADLFKLHDIRVHGASYGSTEKCTLCNKDFKNISSLITHKRNYHSTSFLIQPSHTLETIHKIDSQVYQCDICHKVYQYLYTLNRHKKMAHRTPKRMNHVNKVKDEELVFTVLLYCKFCQQDFTSSQRLKYHYNAMHTGEDSPMAQALKNPIRCNTCSQFFSNFSECRAHSKKVHEISKIKYIQVRKRDVEEYTSHNTPKDKHSVNTKTNKNKRQKQVIDSVHNLLVGKKKRKSDLDEQNEDNRKKIKPNLCTRKVDFQEDEDTTQVVNKVTKDEDNMNCKKDAILDYTCDICQHVISDRVLFRQHREKTHRIRAIWDKNEKYCNICQRKFTSKELYRFHSGDVHDLCSPPSKIQRKKRSSA